MEWRILDQMKSFVFKSDSRCIVSNACSANLSIQSSWYVLNDHWAHIHCPQFVSLYSNNDSFIAILTKLSEM